MTLLWQYAENMHIYIMAPISSLSLVIPLYNEIDSLDPLFLKCLELKGKLAEKLEIIFVNDGSTDGSGKWLEQKAKQYPEVIAIHHPTNQGIGQALKSGYTRAQGEWIAGIPSDLQFDPVDLITGTPFLDEADIISIYRELRPDYSLYRSCISSLNRLLNSLFFGLRLKDINWVKLYRGWVIKEIPVFSTTPFIESERLILAKRKGAKIVEVKAPYYPRKRGKAKGARLKTVLGAFFDFVRFVIR